MKAFKSNIDNIVGKAGKGKKSVTCKPEKSLLQKGKQSLLSALDDVKNMTSKDIEKAIKDNFPSLNKKGSSPDGRFIEYVDSKGRTRIKIHPADPQTLHSHMHIYDSKGNPLDKNLKTGSRRSSDVHIQILEP